MSDQYFSQHRQDEVLANVIFKNKEVGVFLDIGANDGITYSNTFFFEKYRKWNGLCVEPLLSAYKKLEMNRKCLVENYAVGSTNRKDVLLEISGYSEMLSGLKKNYDKRHLSRINNELTSHGGKKREIEVSCINVNDLLLKHSLFLIDYCNIDTEGSEMEIINSIDFKKFRINVITIEANYKIDRVRLKIKLFLRGYRYAITLGNDMLFIHRRFLRKRNSLRDITATIFSLIKPI